MAALRDTASCAEALWWMPMLITAVSSEYWPKPGGPDLVRAARDLRPHGFRLTLLRAPRSSSSAMRRLAAKERRRRAVRRQNVNCVTKSSD
jgi:hypothetical protein